jgi:hypothetical protein
VRRRRGTRLLLSLLALSERERTKPNIAQVGYPADAFVLIPSCAAAMLGAMDAPFAARDYPRTLRRAQGGPPLAASLNTLILQVARGTALGIQTDRRRTQGLGISPQPRPRCAQRATASGSPRRTPREYEVT